MDVRPSVAWGCIAAGVLVAACVVETEPGPRKRLLRDMIPITPPSAMPLPPPLPAPVPVPSLPPGDASTTDARALDAAVSHSRAGNDGGV